MTGAFLFALTLLSSPLPVDSLTFQMGPYSHFVVDTIQQEWWPDLLMLEICPSSSVISPNADSLPCYRIALDTDRRLYRLMATGRDDLSELFEEHPTRIATSALRPFGRFFLDLTQFFDADSIYSVEDVGSFLEANRELKESGAGRPRLLWDSAKSAIVRLLAGRDLKKTTCDVVSESCTIDYYLWREETGSLEFFRLKIGRTGRCDILQHDVLAEEVGYYRALVY